MTPPDGHLSAVCVVHADIAVPGRVGVSGIDKRPRSGPVTVGLDSLDGDHCRDTAHHGGGEQAVYAYSTEDANVWEQELERQLPAGWFGENLRVTGFSASSAIVGERWAIGTAGVVLEVTTPRIPCATFGHWAQERRWPKRFLERGLTGCYLRVISTGQIAADDEIRRLHRPAHGVSVSDLIHFRPTANYAQLRRSATTPKVLSRLDSIERRSP